MIPEGERAMQNEAQRNCQQIASEIGELRVPIGPGREHPIGQGLKRRDSQSGDCIAPHQIGRASCGERVGQYVQVPVVAGSLKKKNNVETHSTHYKKLESTK